MKATGTNPRPFVPMKADSPHLKRFLEEAKRAAEYQAIAEVRGAPPHEQEKKR